MSQVPREPNSRRNPILDPTHASPQAGAPVAPSPIPGSPDWWTGPRPAFGQCPGFGKDGLLHALPQPRLDRCTREEVLAYFDNGWAFTELLFSGLRTLDAFFRPPYHNLRHPLIFYYVHPAALYVNKLRVAGLIPDPIHPYFEQLFETGVDEMGWDDMAKNEMEWPTVPEAHAYRKKCYALVRKLIESHPGLAPDHPPIESRHPLWALFLALEHERIHLETTSVLIRELPLAHLARPAAWAPNAPKTGAPPARTWREVPQASVRIGKPEAFPTFGWDNEYGEKTVSVPAFAVSETLVSNGEFRAFVVAGGYAEKSYWTDEGWHWRSGVNARAPTFWVPTGPAGLHEYELRTVFEVIPFPSEWPALVNFHEAKAYASWRTLEEQPPLSYRLLTEAEHHRLRPGRAENIALRFGSESPVGGLAQSEAQPDVFGNAWQWCEDPFHPLPGFRVHRYYDDFSTPCFDGEHQMILGGSFASLGGEASPHARFHFRPHFFQHAGFRLVRPSVAESPAARLPSQKEEVSSYESEASLGAYCLLHFGTAAETNLPPSAPADALAFPRRCADLVTEWCTRLGLPHHRALDVGCAVGGATFRLAESFGEVWGVDLSANLLHAARALREQGRFDYLRRDEGELSTRLVALVPEATRARAHFRQADASSLPPEMRDFDAVLAANLLCRLPSPRAFLGRLGGARGLVRSGGLLVITSPFSWQERFTPRDAWLGGFARDGRALSSEEGLRDALGASFELLEKRELPLLIREHSRKFEFIAPSVTVWQKK